MRMSGPEHLHEVGRWLRYAHDDLKVAELILEHGQVPRAACFNAQQCAEKSIKAALVLLQLDFPKSHNLRQLCELLPKGWHFREDPTTLSSLTVWAVELRYPGDLPEATAEDAREAVDLARYSYETTFEDLKRHEYEPE